MAPATTNIKSRRFNRVARLIVAGALLTQLSFGATGATGATSAAQFAATSGSATEATTQAAPAAAKLPTERQVVDILLPAIEKYWRSAFAQSGLKFTPARIVFYNVGPKVSWFNHPAQCDLDDADGSKTRSRAAFNTYTSKTWRYGNSFYCPVNKTVYLDYNWGTYLIKAFGAGAAAFILAHEYGHHVSLLTGDLVYRIGEGRWGATELIADCFAGVALKAAYLAKVMTMAVAEKAAVFVSKLGDDIPHDERGSHGTGFERHVSFALGFREFRPMLCQKI